MATAITTNNSWPATLPLPHIEYTGASDVSTIHSPRSSGRHRRRERFKTAYVLAVARFNFTREEFAAFQTFYHDTIHNGSARFEMELRYPKNSELTTWIVQLVAGYNDNPVENEIHNVTVQMQLYRQTALNDKQDAILNFFYVQGEDSDGLPLEQFFVDADDSSGGVFESFTVK